MLLIAITLISVGFVLVWAFIAWTLYLHRSPVLTYTTDCDPGDETD